MSENNHYAQKVIMGAVLGGILAGASIAFFTSRTGRKFSYRTIKKIQDLSEDLGDKVECLCKNNHFLGKDMGDKVECWTDDTCHFLGQVAKGIGNLSYNRNKSLLASILIGTAIGGGIAALTSCTREDKHKGLIDQLACQANSIGKIVQGFIDSANARGSHSNGKSTLKDLANFAVAGMQLFQKMKR